ncbi:MAG: HAD family hydrolase [Alphaproteobacteria bacterium]|nr:HAD family hydrolase [Alphaproteobacteria bacterium]
MPGGWVIIFDVDGVLLELTRAEEELFFQPFASRVDTAKLSRDWNSYRIRNDEDIISEIVERHNLPPREARAVAAEYLALLERQLASRALVSERIAGAEQLLAEFAPRAQLGIATANFRRAAELRLAQVGLWAPVAGLAYGADGGGHKADILARAIAACGAPASRVIFIGDNINDVQAGLANGVHFIGFSESEARRGHLAQAGASRLAAHHGETGQLIRALLQA